MANDVSVSKPQFPTNIKNLITQLDSPNSSEKLFAIKRLAMYYDPQLTSPILKLISDTDPEVREATIVTLGALGDTTKIVSPILITLDDEDDRVVLAAIKTLGELQTNKAVKPLIKMISHENEKVRQAVTIALGQIGDKNALFPLIDALEDKNINVRINSVLALGKIGDLRAVEPIIEILGQESAITQMAALTLGKFQDPRIMQPLIDLLSDRDAKTRQCAIVSLGSLKNPEIIEPMLKLLNDEDPYVRRAAATALSEIKDSTTIQHFIKRLGDSSSDVRETSARALGKLGDKKAIPALSNALSDEDPDVREEAANSLGLMGAAESDKKLIRALKDSEPAVRAAAAHSLGVIEGSKSKDNQSSKNFMQVVDLIKGSNAIRPLIKLLKDSELAVRAKAAEALSRIYIAQERFEKAVRFYKIASEESLTWDFHKEFYLGCAKGALILHNLKNNQYQANVKIFDQIYDHLKTGAKMLGNSTFISDAFWRAVENFNLLFLAKNKETFIHMSKDMGMNYLILTKKLPDSSKIMMDTPQNNLNLVFQKINKKGLPLGESKVEIQLIKQDIYDIAQEILQIEPLELRTDEDTEATIDIIENLTTFPRIGELSDPTANLDAEFLKNFQNPPVVITQEKNYILSELVIGKEHELDDPIQITLVQIHRGARRVSLIEEPREIWERNVKRYYDYNIYQNSRILQFTNEAITMRVKPKIIGYMDDAIYEGSTLVIFPAYSVPSNYIEKLKGFADHFNTFIIAGMDNQQHEKGYTARAYVFSPFDEQSAFQKKNSPEIRKGAEKYPRPWEENIGHTFPPEFTIFDSPFGRFIIYLGEDYDNYHQYGAFFARERNLDFFIILKNCYMSEQEIKDLQKFADETEKAVFFVNSGQFGGTEVFYPHSDRSNKHQILSEEFTEGLYDFPFSLPKSKKKPTKKAE